MNTILKPLIFFIVIPLCCTFWSCEDEFNTSDVGNIYGVVTIKNTGEPMRAVGVELYRYITGGNGYLTPHLLTETVTFDDGHFEFNDLETVYRDFHDNVVSYKYMISVNATGYKQLKRDVVVDPGRTSRIDLQMEAEATGKHLIVVTLMPSNYNRDVTFHGSFSVTSSSWNPYIVGFEYREKDVYGDWKTLPVTTIAPEFKASIRLEYKTYYVRAYAKNSMGTVYGDLIEFSVK